VTLSSSTDSKSEHGDDTPATEIKSDYDHNNIESLVVSILALELSEN
jgi:hypothetical protein